MHKAAGLADYRVPLVDGDPVRILANEFVGSGAFDLSNRDDSNTISADSNEALATVKLVDIEGLSGSQRGDFLRVANLSSGIIDLKPGFTDADSRLVISRVQ